MLLELVKGAGDEDADRPSPPPPEPPDDGRDPGPLGCGVWGVVILAVGTILLTMFGHWLVRLIAP